MIHLYFPLCLQPSHHPRHTGLWKHAPELVSLFCKPADCKHLGFFRNGHYAAELDNEVEEQTQHEQEQGQGNNQGC